MAAETGVAHSQAERGGCQQPPAKILPWSLRRGQALATPRRGTPASSTEGMHFCHCEPPLPPRAWGLTLRESGAAQRKPSVLPAPRRVWLPAHLPLHFPGAEGQAVLRCRCPGQSPFRSPVSCHLTKSLHCWQCLLEGSTWGSSSGVQSAAWAWGWGPEWVKSVPGPLSSAREARQQSAGSGGAAWCWGGFLGTQKP
ncbi:hypothetical protein HJG60_009178 [Phyllostomus discolor]|uniref:Uncharacterized protein n=1 Tax=Phyllostomus discolor TaxID=89673 RepID=A0A833YQ06_9CHIR|nr:hypothetical protein HJG60_009178 [Phyllostomus discolor]